MHSEGTQMTRLELEFIAKVLNRITNPNEQVAKTKAYVMKDLATYDARRGQLRDYGYEDTCPW